MQRLCSTPYGRPSLPASLSPPPNRNNWFTGLISGAGNIVSSMFSEDLESSSSEDEDSVSEDDDVNDIMSMKIFMMELMHWTRMADSSPIVPINALTINTRKSHVIVRVLRQWIQKDRFSKETLEVILADTEGSRIQATVPPYFSRRLKPLLEENMVVIIKNFETAVNVVTNYQKVIINHPVKITVIQATKIESFASPIPIDSHCFSFTPFERFVAGEQLDENITVDVIGCVVTPIGVPEPVPAASNARKLEFKLRDHGGYLLECTLWEAYADRLIQEVDNYADNEVVMIVQFGKYSRWNNRIRVQSMRHATKIHFDKKIPEIEAFLKSLKTDGSTPSRALVSPGAHTGSIDEYFVPANARTITELLNCKEAGIYTVWAKIDYVDHESKWYYDACGNDTCAKGVQKGTKIGDICKKCNKQIPSIVPRYKLTVCVSDHELIEDGGVAKFVIFDRSAQDLINLSASQVLLNLMQYGDGSDMPTEFDVLLERQCLFRVEIDQKYNLNENILQFTVRKLTFNTAHLQRFRDLTARNTEIGSKSAEGSSSRGTASADHAENEAAILDVHPAKEMVPSKRLCDEFEEAVDCQNAEKQKASRRLKTIKKEKI